jgi:N-ethylmaleimide reductase
MSSLFDPIRIGAISAANRIAMAPLTRNRADAGQVPSALAAQYYAQRADAGLIVSEATQVSAVGQGYLDTPGIFNAAQVAGWRRVTDAVHAKGGKIVCQLWHVGRISHVSLQPNGGAPVSSTARRANTKTYTAKGFEEVSTPRALRTEELPGIVAEYRHAARLAIDAGFDGVEIHAANGYLLDQFLRDSINDRTDAYGGTRENRVRLPVEVVAAVVAEIGADRTGIRISPVTPSNDAAQDSNAQGLFEYFIERLAPFQLAFVHVVEGETGGARDVAPFDYESLRRGFKEGNPQGAWIVNNSYTRNLAVEALAQGRADLVAFGRPFISNPDLVERLRVDAPLAPMNPATLYGGGATGYTDYPRMH